MTMTRESITLPVELARELTQLSVGDTSQGWTVVAIEEGEARRWVRGMRLIVSHDSDGLPYEAYYDEGLTEYQETRPWEDEGEAKFEPVERRTRTVEIVEYVTPDS